MRILFTDGIGAAVLHNGKFAPANRAANWKPSPMPVGDSANRQSDGALTLFRYRDDFGATFDLTGIPVAASRPNILDPNGDIVGTVGSVPTGMTGITAPSTAVVALVRSGGAPGDIGYNGFLAKHTRDSTAANTSIGQINFTATTGHLFTSTVAVYLPSGSTVASLTMNLEGSISGVTGPVAADLTKVNQWQILTVSGTGSGSATAPVLRATGPTGALFYSDLWTVDDATLAADRMVDIADRLAYWLNNGGSCEVDTGDYDGSIYTTCGVAPGATIAPPTLSDKKNLEYTLSLSLINLAGSPARMRCHYA